MNQERGYTMKEAAAAADIAYPTIKRYVKQGLLWPEKEQRPECLGWRYRFTQRDIDRAREIYLHNITNLKIGLYEYLERRRDTPLIFRATVEERLRQKRAAIMETA